MRLFYDSTIAIDAKEHILSEEESKHACRVLRMQVGDELAIVNGFGSEFTARIIEANPKKCRLTILSVKTEAAPSSSIHIAIAPTKNNDRIEWFLEKATEIGVTEITLLLCKNNERKNTKEDRFEKILISAMKQSKRLYLPKLNALTPVKDFIHAHPNGLIAHCYDAPKDTIQAQFKPTDCPILIGPEGDFTLEEVDLALKNGYKTITLGENRLRTETAGLYAVMMAKMNIEHGA